VTTNASVPKINMIFYFWIVIKEFFWHGVWC